MSLVEVQPSESNRSKETAVAARRCESRSETSASVVITTNIVASAGASIPAPLAMPPIFQPAAEVAVASFGTESVVIIAWAESAPPSTASF